MIQSYFIAHGSPMIAIDNNAYTKFLTQLGKTLKPKAIVIFTAHWESKITTISSIDGVYDTIYDFYGFPEELYNIKYSAKGSSELALRIKECLAGNKIEANLDEARGLDHGSWTILKLMYPDANIPVVQISVNASLTIKEQIKIGEAISLLDSEDILVIGSGNSVHNLRILEWGNQNVNPWALEFDDWLIDKIKNKDMTALNEYRNLAPNSNLAVPTAEHFVPIFLSMGAGIKTMPGGNEKIPELLYRGYEYGNLSYLVFKF